VTWTWVFVPDSVVDGVPPQDVFTNQGDAESWIGLHWRALAEAGVTSVTLLSEGATSYEMSLASVDE
jgi:hypothetical protein